MVFELGFSMGHIIPIKALPVLLAVCGGLTFGESNHSFVRCVLSNGNYHSQAPSHAYISLSLDLSEMKLLWQKDDVS